MSKITDWILSVSCGVKHDNQAGDVFNGLGFESVDTSAVCGGLVDRPTPAAPMKRKKSGLNGYYEANGNILEVDFERARTVRDMRAWCDNAWGGSVARD